MNTTYASLNEQTRLRGENNDCTVKAVALAANVPYAKAHHLMKIQGRKDGGRAPRANVISALFHLGFQCEDVTKLVPEKTLNQFEQRGLRDTYLIGINGHILVSKNGKIEDWTAGGRQHRIQTVYRVRPIKK